MRRLEAVAALFCAVSLVVSGLVWLFGPYGLLGAGAALGAAVLYFDVFPD